MRTMRRALLVLGLYLPFQPPSRAQEPPAPAPVSAPVPALSVAESTSCLLSDRGAVSCWGLYAGPAAASGGLAKPRPVPFQQAQRGVVSVAATDYAVCSALGSGKVRCRGQAGYVTGAAPGEQLLDVEIPELAGVRALYAGSVHVCAVGAGGVSCWGSDTRGESSTRPGSPARSAPVRIELPAVRSMALGSEHTCALTLDGRVFCWGGTQLSGCVGDHFGVKEPHELPALRGATQLAAGLYHTCALRPDGHVACVGFSRVCQLGVLGPGSRTPFEVPAVDQAVAIAAAAYSTCALRKDGRVLCWGDNQRGQLGSGAIDPKGLRQVAGTDCTPTEVAGLRDARAIAVGPAHACALRAGGSVVCWGENQAGQLGDGTFTRRLMPVPVQRLVP